MKKGKGLIITGLLLIAAALCLIGYNVLENCHAGRAAAKALEQLLPLMGETIPEEGRYTVDYGDLSEIGAGEIEYPDYLLDSSIEMPTVMIEGLNYIGVLEIPELELKLPIIEEWSYRRLNIAPCLFEGCVYKDDMIICAHNYEYFFGHLHSLSLGSELSFTDVDGNVFRYRVTEITIYTSPYAEEMEEGDWDLTLFTCTVGGAARVMARCERIS